MQAFLPSRCIIETEYICNLKCQSCILWKKNYRKLRGEDKDSLDFYEILTIQKKLANLGIRRITYIGGEPFLNKKILEISLNAIENGIIPAIVTNGTLLNEEKIRLIIEKKIFKTIIFSLDGNENIHDFIRGAAGTFEKILGNLILFRKIKNSQKTGLPKIYVYATISALNYKYIEDIYKIALSVNANKIRFQLASSVNGEIIEKTNNILGFKAISFHSYINNWGLNQKQILQARNSIFKIVRLKKSNIRIEVEESFLKGENKKCHFIYKDFVITPSGNILACPMLTGFSIGNIKDVNFEEAFLSNREKIDLILNLAQTGKLPICRECCVEKIRF